MCRKPLAAQPRAKGGLAHTGHKVAGQARQRLVAGLSSMGDAVGNVLSDVVGGAVGGAVGGVMDGVVRGAVSQAVAGATGIVKRPRPARKRAAEPDPPPRAAKPSRTAGQRR